MKNLKFILFDVLCVISSLTIELFAQETQNEKIWMTYPGDITKNWESQVFHLGNGYFGASCYGGVQQEIFTLSEKTFWTGGPGDGEVNTYGVIKDNVLAEIDSIRTYTSLGDFKNSDRLVKRVFKSDVSTLGGLSTIGELYMNFPKEAGMITNYKRELDLANSTVSIEYKVNNIKYQREYFCSYPDRVLALHLTSDKVGTINMNIGINLMHTTRNPEIKLSAENGTIEVFGNIDDNNRPYVVKIKVVNQGGRIKQHNKSLELINCNVVDVYYTVATNYTLNPPLYKGNDPVRIANSVIEKVLRQGYEKTKEIHVADYQNLYKRTSFHLANEVPEREKLPTNERLNFYINKQDYTDLGLKELAFNLGKYILISSSRPKALPAGLQGAWNNRYTASWNGTYQLDMNVTQTYMFGNALNLPECQEPFIEWIKDRAKTGKQIVKSYYNLDDAWASFLISDIWGHAGILSDVSLSFFSTGWLSLILWEQYAFENNISYLRQIYPILKEAAVFYMDNLVEYKNTGYLVFSSGASAEHISSLGATIPGFQDIAFAQETFENVITASEILRVDKTFRKKLQKLKNRLMPYKIGRLGQLQEWVEDVDDPNCQHRHISHLLALQPCKQINPYKYPELMEAMKKTMNLRGDADFKALKGIGCNSREYPSKCLHEGLPFDNYTAQVWCRAARICNWLRLFDGDRADKIYNDILRESTLENMIQYETKANYSDEPTSTPFFLDGTVLSAGYVTEMVLQSQYGFLDILPALPSAWNTGFLKGIKARGGFIVDVEWKDGELVKATIKSNKDAMCKIHYKGADYDQLVLKDIPFVFYGKK